MKESDFALFMPVDVYEAYAVDETGRGTTGPLVLCQELPSLDSDERFARIIIPMADARRLAEAILAAASSTTRAQGGLPP